MFFGQPGSYKSMVTSLIALTISNGGEFLDKQAKQSPVLICDMENGLIEIRDRLMKIAKGHDMDKTDFPLFITESSINLNQKIFREALFEVVEDNNIKLVVLDTLNRFGNYDENSASDINRIYTDVFKPLKELGCSILFLHHTQKNSNEYRGSGDFLGNVDLAFSVIKKSYDCEIKNTKNRFGVTGDTTYSSIEFGDDTIYMGIKEPPEMKQHKGMIARSFIINKLVQGDAGTTEIWKEIKKVNKEISKRTIEREISKLLESGLLEHRLGLYHLETKPEKVE